MARSAEPWLKQGPLWTPCLRLCSLLYALGWRLTRLWRGTRPAQVGVPVLSVGNLSVGGTGKSVLVRALARRAARAGLRPAILLRGYRAAPGPRPLRLPSASGALADPHRFGDEAVEHALDGSASVWVDANRRRGARAAVDAGAACLVLDDGFQRRWQLARNLDLLLADYQELQAGERLLPAGPFREPWSQARLAGAVLVSGAPLGLKGEALRGRLPEAWRQGPVFRLDREPLDLRPWPSGAAKPLSALRGRAVLALSGLGRPQGFEDLLASLGAQVQAWRFADHHAFSLQDLKLPAGKARFILTTAKDAARLPASWEPSLPVFVLRVRAAITPSAPFWRLVDKALRPEDALLSSSRKGFA